MNWNINSRLLFSALIILAIIGEVSLPVVSALSSGLGPAFNSVEKIPVVKPSRDYLPANYTHALNFIFKFTDAPENQQRENGIATTLLHDNIVRVYAYNSYNNRLAIADVDLVTLERRVKWRLLQYFEIPSKTSPYITVEGKSYPVVTYFQGSKPLILGSHDTGQETVLVSYLYRKFVPAIEFYHGSYRQGYRGVGPLVITVLNKRDAETYLLDLGARDSRMRTSTGVMNMFPPGERAALHTSIKFIDGRLQVAQATLERPGFPVMGWLDYVNLTTMGTRDRSFIETPGAIIASIDLSGMNVINASFIHADGYNVTAKAIPTSDGGFLALLAAEKSVLIIKIGSNFSIEWSTEVDLNAPLVPYMKSRGIQPVYQAAFRIAEAGNGYAVLLPMDGKPLLVFLDFEGTIKWSAYLNTTKIGNFVNAHLSASNNMIYVTWHTGPPPGSHTSNGIALVTLVSTSGKVIGFYSSNSHVEAYEDLFAEVHGELGNGTTILCRPEGYRWSRVPGYIDAAYLMEDYETMDLGGPGNPFTRFMSNEEGLAEGIGWNVSTTGMPWVNATYGYTNITLEYYSKVVFTRTGGSVKADNLEIRATRIATVIEDPNTVWFLPSFYYPIAILPEEVDFGQVHVGEEKAVDLEMIWLTQIPETAESISYHNPASENPDFRVDKPIWVALGGIKNPDIDVGKRVRVRLYFKPSKPGMATSTYGIAQGPRGLYVWSPISFNYPRQTIPLRGFGVAENQSIKTGWFPATLGLSAASYSMPGHILPGQPYRESVYITNVGNGEMVFLEGVMVLPGSKVLKVEGADMVIGIPGEPLDPFFVVAVKLKPLETRRLDIYMKLNAEIADPQSPLHLLSRRSFRHGVIVGEVASLPQYLWNSIVAKYKGKEYLAVDEAMKASKAYIEDQLISFFTSRSIDEAGSLLDRLNMENPVLFDYIKYLVLTGTLLTDNWMFRDNDTAKIYPSNTTDDKVSVPVTQVIVKDNTTLEMIPVVSEDESSSDAVRFASPKLQLAAENSWNPSFMWYVREFFKPSEFTETAMQGLIGLGKGTIETVSLGFIQMEAENDYQAAGKIVGVVAANVEMILAEPLMGAKLEQLGTAAFSAASKTLQGIAESGSRLAFLYKMEGKFKTLAGLERIVMTTEEGEVWGTIFKWSFNENFAEQGWYLGIGYIRNEVVNINGKLIAKTFFHYYPRAGKVAVYMFGKIRDVPLRQFYRLGVLLRMKNMLSREGFFGPLGREMLESLSDPRMLALGGLALTPPLWQWLWITGLAENLGIVSFSADPNYAEITPSPFISDKTKEAYAKIHFENLPNATAPAYNITVKIHLEGPVNASTLRLWDASHPETMENYNITHENGEIVITVRFTNITLPPNKEPPEGEGWLAVKFMLNNDAEPGDRVKVYADVYFDYNPPVRTNTAESIYDPEPPRTSFTANTRPGGLTLSPTCSDAVSGCNITMLMITGLQGSSYGPFTVNTSTSIDIPLQPGIYMITLISRDNAGNIAEYTANITVPENPEKESTLTTTSETTTSRFTSPSITPKEESHGNTYLLTAILAAIIAVVILLYTRKHKP